MGESKTCQGFLSGWVADSGQLQAGVTLIADSSVGMDVEIAEGGRNSFEGLGSWLDHLMWFSLE
jgi:hypothetical protein